MASIGSTPWDKPSTGEEMRAMEKEMAPSEEKEDLGVIKTYIGRLEQGIALSKDEFKEFKTVASRKPLLFSYDQAVKLLHMADERIQDMAKAIMDEKVKCLDFYKTAKQQKIEELSKKALKGDDTIPQK
jgi:hypothetical protein